MHKCITKRTTQKTKKHARPIATLPAVDKPCFPQNRGQFGKEGTPHNPLLLDKLTNRHLKLDELQSLEFHANWYGNKNLHSNLSHDLRNFSQYFSVY